MNCLVCQKNIGENFDLCTLCAPGFWEETTQALRRLPLARAYPEVWPVIHVEHQQSALENAAIAARAGAEGVFLIQMNGYDDQLDPLIHPIRARHPELKVGFNFLSLAPLEALKRSVQLKADATWSDRPGVRSDGISPEAEETAELLTHHPHHLFFASIAFKYQPVDFNPWLAAQKARYLGMIPTTSGEATGSAPSLEKIQRIQQDRKPDTLALASGITPENIGDFSAYLSHCLVSTGISKNFEHFDENKLKRLIDRVRLDIGLLF